jgi:hypothetical protein
MTAHIRSKTVSTVDERLNAVSRLHRPVVEWGLHISCIDGDCEHEDGNCPEVPFTICQECDGLRRDVSDEALYQEWPCDTAKAGGFDHLEPTAATTFKGN